MYRGAVVMKKLFKNKYLFKLRNLWVLLRSNSYCLITIEKKSDNTFYIDTARINFLTDTQNDVIQTLCQHYESYNLSKEQKLNSIVREAKQLISKT